MIPIATAIVMLSVISGKRLLVPVFLQYIELFK